MTEQDIKDIISLRWAVYKLGVENNRWNDLTASSAPEYMDFLFPHTGHMAYYNLMIEIAKGKHKDMLPKGVYCLFKMPEQIEEQVMDYMKKSSPDSSTQDATMVVHSLATIQGGAATTAVNIGRLDDIGLHDALRLIAYYYKIAFENGDECYPYFE